MNDNDARSTVRSTLLPKVVKAKMRQKPPTMMPMLVMCLATTARG